MYGDLRKIAARFRRKESARHRFDTSDLLNQAYLKLISPMRGMRFDDRSHFLMYATTVMRHILVETVRETKGIGEIEPVTLSGVGNLIADGQDGLPQDDFLDLHEALCELEAEDKRASLVFQLIHFYGYDQEEAAKDLEISLATAKRDLRKAWDFVLKKINTTVIELNEQISLELVKLSGGDFRMGPSEKEEDGQKSKPSQHNVWLPTFYIGRYAVTQAQWRVVAGWEKIERDLNPEPAQFKGENRPVECVSWEDAMEFCARLAKKTSKPFRLSSEAEWEYACRGGRTSQFAFGGTISAKSVNFVGQSPDGTSTSRKETVEVGSLGLANGFGLYDMHGNVWEWCIDPWRDDYKSVLTDGSARENDGETNYRAARGGSWNSKEHDCRSASRIKYAVDQFANSIGFRVVLADLRRR
jgi:RNA polymerase sigma factor (TIGR02999 family)